MYTKLPFLYLFLIIFILVHDVVDSNHSPEKDFEKQIRRQQKAERRRLRKLSKLGLLPQDQLSPVDLSFPETNGCPVGNFCVRVRDCPFVSDGSPGEGCILGQNIRGVCCAARSNQTPKQPLQPFNPLKSLSQATGIPIITPADIQKAVLATRNWMQGLQQTENSIQDKRLFASSFSEEGQHQNFLGNNAQSNQMGRTGAFFIKMIQFLMSSFGLTPVQSQSAFQAISFVNSVTGTCPRPIRCPRNAGVMKYRTPDGSCNNLNNPDWGMSFSPFNRLLHPQYDDGFDSPRITAKNGQSLPSARLVSSVVAPDDTNALSDRLTLMTMQWGQFLDHDITGAATTRSSDGKSIRCCDPAMDQNPSLLHPACFRIEIPSNDPFYSRVGKTCMSFVRSAPAPRLGCQFGPREQLNQLSSYIDGGMIYGKTFDDQQKLRSFQDGRLQTSLVDNTEFLPQKQGGCAIPRQKQATQGCFFSGDGRVNVQANLVVIHALFLRHHNRVAGQLKSLNPSWNDETLFQEARRIVIAQLQIITYNEFLPVVLGGKTLQEFRLIIQPNGQYSNNYDPNVNSQILSSFATAAYRMHTLIPKSLDFVSTEKSSGATTKVGQVDLSETFNNPSIIYESGAFSHLLNGLTTESSSDFDQLFTNQISHHMFRPFGASSGIDLIAVNIQRGRDHGLPSFNDFRKHCGLNPVTNWKQLASILRPGAVSSLRSVYSSPEDIDLFIGGVSETPLPGSNSLVGPTFACIIGEQFRRIKDGDRFWFEQEGQPGSFTIEQLDQLKKTSLAQIICDSGPQGVTHVQPLVFIKENEWNRRTSCESLARPDLSFWQNEPVG